MVHTITGTKDDKILFILGKFEDNMDYFPEVVEDGRVDFNAMKLLNRKHVSMDPLIIGATEHHVFFDIPLDVVFRLSDYEIRKLIRAKITFNPSLECLMLNTVGV